jgi:tetratricopeptide (TPR) repeat protein
VPGDADLLADVAAVQLASGDVQQGIASLDRAAQLQPRSAQAQLRLAQAHLQAGNGSRARSHANQALALAPDALPGLRLAMQLALDDQQPARALDLARGAQKRQPRSAVGWQLEAELAARHKRWPEAVTALRAALAREEATDLAMAMNMALGQAGTADEQLRFQQQWLKNHPRDARFIAHLGELAVLKVTWRPPRPSSARP